MVYKISYQYRYTYLYVKCDNYLSRLLTLNLFRQGHRKAQPLNIVTMAMANAMAVNATNSGLIEISSNERAAKH